MKNKNIKKSKIKLPKYPLGGNVGNLFKTKDQQFSNDYKKGDGFKGIMGDIGDTWMNTMMGAGDAALTSIGASDVIKDSDYKGTGANYGRNYGNVIGDMGKIALPLAASTIAPGSGQFVSMGQQQIANQSQANYNQNPNIDEATQAYNMYNQMYNQPLMYPNGGSIPGIDMRNLNFEAGGGLQGEPAELEKRENVVMPNGQFQQFNGASHQNGGIQTQLPNNTIVFSDKLKASTGKTFAKENMKNNTNKEDKVLSDSKASSLSKKTADMMKLVKLQASNKLFQEQESMKQDKFKSQLEKDMYACGGMIKYKNGGIHIKPENRGKFTEASKKAGMGVQEYANHILSNKENFSSTLVKRANFANNAIGWKHEYGGVIKYTIGGNVEPTPFNPNYMAYPGPYNPSVFEEGPQFKDVNLTDDQITYNNQDQNIWGNIPSEGMPSNFNTNPNVPNKQLNWNKIGTNAAYGLANNAGYLYDLYRAKDVETQGFNPLNPNLLNPSEALRNADIQARMSANDLANIGDRGSYLGARIAQSNANTLNKANIHQQYDNANTGIKNQFGQYNDQRQYQTDMYNAMNRGQQRNLKSNAIGNIGQNTASQITDNRLTNADERRMQLLSEMYKSPEFKKFMETYNKTSR